MQEETTNPSSTIHPNNNESQAERLLVVNTTNGILMLTLAHILYAEAEGAFTTLFMHDGRQHIVARTLKDSLNVFGEYGFVKVNRTCLVNQSWISRLLPAENIMELKSGHRLTVTRHFMKEVLSLWKIA